MAVHSLLDLSNIQALAPYDAQRAVMAYRYGAEPWQYTRLMGQGIQELPDGSHGYIGVAEKINGRNALACITTMTVERGIQVRATTKQEVQNRTWSDI